MTDCPRPRPPRAALCLAAALLALAVPGSAAPAPVRGEDAPVLRVLAAASLTDVVEELARRYEGARVEASFGGSSALARQIRDGAPADVFLSASPEWMEFLREAGAVAGEPLVLARNRLVCIAPRESPIAAAGPGELLERIGVGGRVAIADDGVPAGEYARVALRHLGLLDAFRPHLVGQKDVRAVLHAVEQDALDAGFAYATDAAVARVRVLFTFDPAAHPPIEYQAAVLRGAARPAEARRFLAYLHGPAARATLAAAGFAQP